MNFIKFDQYDQMYFAYLEHKYDLFRSLQISYNKLLDKDLLFDFYNSHTNDTKAAFFEVP